MLTQTGTQYRTSFGFIQLAKTPEMHQQDGSEMRVELDVELANEEAIQAIRELLGSFEFIANRKDLRIKRKCTTVLIIKTGKQIDTSKKQYKVRSDKNGARSAALHAVEHIMAAANRIMEKQRSAATSSTGSGHNNGADAYKNDPAFVGARR